MRQSQQRRRPSARTHVGDAKVTTIEAIGKTPAGKKIQEAWLDREVPQWAAGYAARPDPHTLTVDNAGNALSLMSSSPLRSKSSSRW
jgi:hypothetical protein